MIGIRFVEDGDKPKTVRCKTRCGLTVSWGIDKIKGSWRVTSVGKAKQGQYPVPADFIPFDLTKVVMARREFPTRADAEIFVRSL